MTAQESRLEWSSIQFKVVSSAGDDDDDEFGGIAHGQRSGGGSRHSLSTEVDVSSSGPNDVQNTLQKKLTYLLIGSVTLGSLLGIFCILLDIMNDFVARLIETIWVVALFSLLGMACESAKVALLQREENCTRLSRLTGSSNGEASTLSPLSSTIHAKHLLLVPKAGLALTSTTAVLLVVMIWFPSIVNGEWFSGPWFGRITAVTAIYAVASVHICLLALAVLPRRYEFLFWLATQIILVVATVLAVNMFYPLFDTMGAFFKRLVTILVILDLAISSVIPMLHRVGTMEAAEAARQAESLDVATIDRDIAVLQEQLERLHRLRDGLLVGHVGASNEEAHTSSQI